MTSHEQIESLSASTKTLEAFADSISALSPQEVVASLTKVSACIRAAQPVLDSTIASSDSVVKHSLSIYRTQLQRLPEALHQAEVRLVAHQQQLYVQIARLGRRSSWATSCKSSIAEPKEASLNVKG